MNPIGARGGRLARTTRTRRSGRGGRVQSNAVITQSKDVEPSTNSMETAPQSETPTNQQRPVSDAPVNKGMTMTDTPRNNRGVVTDAAVDHVSKGGAVVKESLNIQKNVDDTSVKKRRHVTNAAVNKGRVVTEFGSDAQADVTTTFWLGTSSCVCNISIEILFVMITVHLW